MYRLKGTFNKKYFWTKEIRYSVCKEKIIEILKQNLYTNNLY